MTNVPQAIMRLRGDLVSWALVLLPVRWSISIKAVLPNRGSHLSSPGHWERWGRVQITCLHYGLDTDGLRFEIWQTWDNILALPSTSSVTLLLGKLANKYHLLPTLSHKTVLAAKKYGSEQKIFLILPSRSLQKLKNV